MALTIRELKQQVALLVEQAEAQSRISNSLEDYLKGLEESKRLSKEINRLREKEGEVIDKIRALRAAGNHAEADDQEEILILLKKKTDELEEQNKIFGENLKKVKVTNLLMMKGVAEIGKGLAKIPGLIQQGYGKIKGLGLFEMDKAVKMSALSMGVLSKEGKGFSDNLRKSALYSNSLGVGLEELAKMQADYSEELGRNVVLSEEGLKAMTQLSTVVGLGAEGAAKMSADMDNMGYSAEKTRDFVNETLNDAHKMGLNASKVIKNISGNMKMLNKYNFKGGVKGLAKMAETTAKLGVDMSFATGMADKLFDIEGAVDMSAQLQVMGGEWSKLADPFKLMYMARNDMEGLTAALGKAAESSVHFNKENGEFEISAMEMHRLRKVAEQMGVSYEELAQAGKNAAKFTKIKSQMNFSIGGSEEDKQLAEYLTNKGFIEDGKAKITIGSDKKLLSTLSEADKKILRDQVKEQQNIEKRAQESQTFDDKLTNLINMMKVTLIPIIDGIDSVLGPIARDLMGSDDFKDKMVSLGKDIAGFVKLGAEIVKSVAKFAVWLGPTGTLMAFLGIKGLMSAAGWIANGFALAKGFNMANGGGIGGVAKTLGTGALGVSGAVAGIAGGSAIGGGGGGAMIGSAIGTAAGALGYLIPGVGWITGPALMALGGMAGGYLGGMTDKPAHDAIISKPAHDAIISKPMHDFEGTKKIKNMGGMAGSMTDKPAHDAIISKPMHDFESDLENIGKGLGSDFSENRAIAETKKSTSLIEGGRIRPIDNKDEFFAKKPGGAIDEAMNEKQKVSIVKHEFGVIKFDGDININTPGGEKTSIDFVKDPMVWRTITNMVQSEALSILKQNKA
jgi:hypothetical protein